MECTGMDEADNPVPKRLRYVDDVAYDGEPL